MKATASLMLPLLPLACLLAGCGTLSYHGLQTKGVAADAEVLDHWEDGFNDHLVVGLKVRVQPAGQSPFVATIERAEISPLNIEQLKVGALVPVHFDPRQPAQVRIDPPLAIGDATATGVAAPAEILAHWNNGPRITRELRIGLRLRVRPADGAPFEEVLRVGISPLNIPQFRRGAVISVHFDPKNRAYMTADLALDGPPVPEPNLVSTVAIRSHSGVPRGVAADAEILKHWDLTRRTSDDPDDLIVGLAVRVRPADRPAYEATIERTGISPLDIPQFQPGSVIPVHFDPKDPSRVTVDLSPGGPVKNGG